MNNPLVSLIVIAYNSSKYVLEALESIKQQSYENIELIITDDCSKDDTITKCQEWLGMNSQRFIRSQIITHYINSGISANCNRGIFASSGKWLMLIGADDKLLPDCIKTNLEFIDANPRVRVCHSQCDRFLNNFNSKNNMGIRDFSNIIITHPKITARQQYEILLRGCLINPTTAFIEKSLIEEIGMIDEEIPMVDDWPLWLRITKADVKIYFFNTITACYRIRYDSIANERIVNSLFNDVFFHTRIIYLKYIFPYISNIERFFINYEYYRLIFLKKTGISRSIFFHKVIAYAISRPSVWYLTRKRQNVFKNIEKKIKDNHVSPAK